MACYDAQGNPRWVVGAVDYLRSIITEGCTRQLAAVQQAGAPTFGLITVPDLDTANAAGSTVYRNDDDLYHAAGQGDEDGLYRYYIVDALTLVAYTGGTQSIPPGTYSCNVVGLGAIKTAAYGSVSVGTLIGAPSILVAPLACAVGAGYSLDACGALGNALVIQVPYLVLMTIGGIAVPGDMAEYAPEHVIGAAAWYPATNFDEGALAAQGESSAPWSLHYGGWPAHTLGAGQVPMWDRRPASKGR